MDQDTLPRIRCDHDWLDLRDGERGVMQGPLTGPLRRGAEMLAITNTAWDTMVVAIDPPYQGKEAPAGRSVTMTVMRNEDGVTTSDDDIAIEETGK